MSDYALQTWDDQGRVTLDTGLRPQRIIGSISVPASSSSGVFTDVRMAEGEPVWIVLSGADNYYDRASVSFDRPSSTFSWSPPPYPFILLYGTF
ncbi:hypothetical protein [uncultured Brevundimonas sp.]|uniref:hypothetical protein n=1 Tax=uncultured Brevundimonas sp. TaxID=213418 RepID=UPI0025EAEDE9|nr:hypothetical protein [uncultured Brevundimonas sp.]